MVTVLGWREPKWPDNNSLWDSWGFSIIMFSESCILLLSILPWIINIAEIKLFKALLFIPLISRVILKEAQQQRYFGLSCWHGAVGEHRASRFLTLPLARWLFTGKLAPFHGSKLAGPLLSSSQIFVKTRWDDCERKLKTQCHLFYSQSVVHISNLKPSDGPITLGHTALSCRTYLPTEMSEGSRS